MRAAIKSIQQSGALSWVAAAPVGSVSACRSLEAMNGRVVCVYVPEPFYGVAEFYRNFDQVSDDEVRDLLRTAHFAPPFEATGFNELPEKAPLT